MPVDLPVGTHNIVGRRIDYSTWVPSNNEDPTRTYVVERGKLDIRYEKLSGSRITTGRLVGGPLKVSEINNDGSTDYKPLNLDFDWNRVLRDAQGYFVKGFDQTITVEAGDVVFLFFSEGTFYKNPVPVSIIPREEAESIIKAYRLTGDIKDDGDQWAYHAWRTPEPRF